MFFLCLCGSIGIGFLHATAQKEVSMFLLYLVPIIVGANYLEKAPAYTITTVALITWSAAYLSLDAPQSKLLFLWNVFARVVLFFGTTLYTQVLLARIESERALRLEMERLQQASAPLATPQLACDECGRLGTSRHEWVSPLEFLRSVVHAEIHSCICPDCLDKTKNLLASNREAAADQTSQKP